MPSSVIIEEADATVSPTTAAKPSYQASVTCRQAGNASARAASRRRGNAALVDNDEVAACDDGEQYRERSSGTAQRDIASEVAARQRDIASKAAACEDDAGRAHSDGHHREGIAARERAPVFTGAGPAPTYWTCAFVFASWAIRAFWISPIMPSTRRGSVKTFSFGASDFA